MPDNKNQHYVPRCHLRPFTLDRAGAAINMFNHARGIVREKVAVSGQCSKSYFYGEDLFIERQLQSLEGRYARVVRTVENGDRLSVDDLAFLRSFVFLQWCRTDAAMKRRRDIMEAMEDMAIRGRRGVARQPLDTSQLSLVYGSLKLWAEGMRNISDLRVLLLRNQSRVNFVTSDDPAVLTNRLFMQRFHDTNFGVANTGAMLFLPLGPRYAVACYDHAAYAPQGRIGNYLDIKRDRDAQALNELQFLNSLSNIYFADRLGEAGRIREHFAAVAHRRPETKFRTWHGVSEGIENGFEAFRRVQDGELLPPDAVTIQSFSPLYPQPANWLSLLVMRPEISGWIVPGTAGGPRRQRGPDAPPGIRLMNVGHGPMANRRGGLPDRMYHRLSLEELESRGVR